MAKPKKIELQKSIPVEVNAVDYAEETLVSKDDNKGWLYSLIVLGILGVAILFVFLK